MNRTICQSAWISLGIAAMVTPAGGQSIKTIEGHKEPVAAIAFRPDGKSIATGSFDKHIKLWDAQSLAETRTLSGHTNLVLTLAFSPDGSRLLSGGQDNLVKLWYVGEGQSFKATDPTPAPLRSLAVSPDGKLLVSTSDDGILRIHDPANPAPIKELTGHSGPVYACQFSSDASRLVSAGADRTVRIWDLATGNALGLAEVGTQPATQVAFLPDGKAVFTGSPTGQVKRWPAGLAAPRAIAITEPARTMAVHPDGQRAFVAQGKSIAIVNIADGKQVGAIVAPAGVRDLALTNASPETLATVDDSNAVRLWRLADGSPIGALDGLADPRAIAWSSDAKGVLVGMGDGTVRRIDLPLMPTIASRALPAHDGPMVALSRSADGNLLLTASQDKSIRLWDSKGSPIRAFAMFAPVTHATLSPSQPMLAAVSMQGEARVWNVNGQELAVLQSVRGPVAFSPDGNWLAVTGTDHQIQLHPTSFNAPPTLLSGPKSPTRAVAFVAQGNLVLSAGNDNVVRVHDVATAKEVRVLAGHQAAVNALAVSPDGTKVASASDDKSVIVWDLASGNPIATLTGASAPVVSLAISSDGRTLAAAAEDETIRLYQDLVPVASVAQPAPIAVTFAGDSAALISASGDLQLRFWTVRPLPVVGKHDGAVAAIAVSPDGKLAATGGADKQVHLWDLAAGARVRSMAHDQGVLDVEFSPDGARLVSGSADQTCRVWNVADGAAAAKFEAAKPVNSVAYARDGQRFVFGSLDGLVRIHDAQGNELQTITLTGDAVASVAIAGDSRSVLAAGSKSIQVVPSVVEWVQSHGGPVTALVATANGARLLSASSDNTVAVRDPANGNVAASISVPAPSALATASDGSRSLVGSSDGAVRLFDLNSNQPIQEYPKAPAAITSVAWSTDGKSVAFADAGGTATLASVPADGKPGAPTQTFKGAAPAVACSILGDQQTLACAHGDRVVRYYVPIPPVLDLAGHKSQVYGVAFSPDGKTAASCSADNSVMLWDVATGKQTKTLSGHKAPVYSVAFNADGSQLASASGDKSVILWNVAEGKPIHTLSGPKDMLFQVIYRPGTTQVLAGGVEKVIHVWDSATGQPVKTLAGQPDEIYGMAFNADGKRLATSGYAGNLLIWDPDGDKPLYQQKLAFGAFDVAYHPVIALVAVANNDTKTYLVKLPKESQ